MTWEEIDRQLYNGDYVNPRIRRGHELCCSPERFVGLDDENAKEKRISICTDYLFSEATANSFKDLLQELGFRNVKIIPKNSANGFWGKIKSLFRESDYQDTDVVLNIDFPVKLTSAILTRIRAIRCRVMN